MNVDGKEIAERVYKRTYEEIQRLDRTPVLSIITCAPNFETQKYLALKEKKAAAIGITTRVIELHLTNTTEDFCAAIEKIVPDSDGIIVQLPLPPHVDVQTVFAHIPVTHDVDALNPENHSVLSPVVGAFFEILSLYNIVIEGKQVTVIGNGRLVGLPACAWFQSAGAHVSVVTKDTGDISSYTKIADIVVCGAGVPGLLLPDMIKNDVIILDAGTSEEGGELRGDADPLCAEKASLFTPVPGGIGPITIAILLSNVVLCASRKELVV
jgi:methylenetetrahydrofolate dehydrogenase (NADP+) / methenyltetrahydrofolate cyclohydrolase